MCVSVGITFDFIISIIPSMSAPADRPALARAGIKGFVEATSRRDVNLQRGRQFNALPDGNGDFRPFHLEEDLEWSSALRPSVMQLFLILCLITFLVFIYSAQSH